MALFIMMMVKIAKERQLLPQLTQRAEPWRLALRNYSTWSHSGGKAQWDNIVRL